VMDLLKQNKMDEMCIRDSYNYAKWESRSIYLVTEFKPNFNCFNIRFPSGK